FNCTSTGVTLPGNVAYSWANTGTITVQSSYVPETPFGASSGEYVNFNMTPLGSVTLPNGKQFLLSYYTNSGLLKQITLPSGGYIKYTWARPYQNHTQG